MKQPDLPEMEGYILTGHRAPVTPEDAAMRRAIVDWLGMWEECPRNACRQAQGCRSRMTACFDERRPVVIDCTTDFVFEGYWGDPGDDDDDEYE